MSGHSHYATIKRKKQATDATKGKVFSKHAKGIALAVKQGGSADPENNSRLRFAIEQAKSDNVPKANIERILKKANEMANIEEVTYEGFGPEGIAVLVEVATSNRNRTAQEMKNLFERNGGSLAGPGSVSYNFEPKTLIVIKKGSNPEDDMLKIIDLGIEDIEEVEDGIEIYIDPGKTSEIREKLLQTGFEIESLSILKKPKSFIQIPDPTKARKIISFLDTLEEHEDTQNVYTNIDIPQETADKINI